MLNNNTYYKYGKMLATEVKMGNREGTKKKRKWKHHRKNCGRRMDRHLYWRKRHMAGKGNWTCFSSSRHRHRLNQLSHNILISLYEEKNSKFGQCSVIVHTDLVSIVRSWWSYSKIKLCKFMLGHKNLDSQPKTLCQYTKL